jgi:hypothetical protein
MAYVYKIFMNSFYGRFDINSKSTIAEVRKKKRYDYLIQKKTNIISDNKLKIPSWEAFFPSSDVGLDHAPLASFNLPRERVFTFPITVFA